MGKSHAGVSTEELNYYLSKESWFFEILVSKLSTYVEVASWFAVASLFAVATWFDGS